MSLTLVEELATILAWESLNHAANAGDEEAMEVMSNVQAAFDEEFSIYCNELDYHMDEQCRSDISYRFHNEAEDRLRKEPTIAKHLTSVKQIKPLMMDWK